MDIVFIYAQMLGTISICLGLICFAVKNKDRIYLFNGLSNLVKAVQYLFLQGYTGAISCLIAMIRNIIFKRFNKKVPIGIIIAFITVAIIIQFKSVNNFFDILPIFNICFFAFCLGSNNERFMKIGLIITCFSAMGYDLYYKAYISFIYDVVAFFVSTCSYYYYFIRKENKRIENLT